MLISEAITVILEANARDVVMKDLGVSSPLVSSWKSSSSERIPHFKVAVKIYGIYDIVVYPYNESDLRDKWHEVQLN